MSGPTSFRKSAGSRSFGASRNNTPVRPRHKPSQPRPLSRSPRGNSISSSAIHNGVVAARTAAAPLGTVFSASVMSPLPPTNSNTPPTATPARSRRCRRSRSPRSAR